MKVRMEEHTRATAATTRATTTHCYIILHWFENTESNRGGEARGRGARR